MVHRRYAKNFAFHPPWGDCREIGLIRASDPQERPPPPPDADESSLKTPYFYPKEKAKRLKNAETKPRRLKRKELEKKKIVVL